MKAGALVIGVVAVAFGTWWLGWWFPAVWGAVAGLAWPHHRPGRIAALSACGGWAVWLLVPVVGGAPLGTLAARLGGLFQLPGWVLIVVTLAFPALLALCAAVLTARVRGSGPASGTAPVRQTPST